MPEEQVVEEQSVAEQDEQRGEPAAMPGAETDAAGAGDQVDRIERLAGKVRGLIALAEQNRAELARANEANERLQNENEELRAQLVTAEATSAELATVLNEREQVRSRVEDLLEQLEAIDI